MGIRIEYYKTNSKKSINEILKENYPKFRTWYLERENLYGNIGEIEFVEFLKNNTEFKIENVDKKILDELFEEMMLEYESSDDFIENIGSSLSKWRYEKSNNLINKTQNNELKILWNYITKGRSLKNNLEYNGYSNDYKMSFLLKNEQEKLKKLLLNTFGNLEQIKEKYWTRTEKKEWEKWQKDINYYPIKDNPISTAIELVLEVLNEMENMNSTLIIGIEQ